MIDTRITLNQLTELCSRLEQGLSFVASNEKKYFWGKVKGYLWADRS